MGPDEDSSPQAFGKHLRTLGFTAEQKNQGWEGLRSEKKKLMHQPPQYLANKFRAICRSDAALEESLHIELNR